MTNQSEEAGILRLLPRPATASVQEQVNMDAVRIARRILEMAEQGEIRQLVVAYETSDRYDGVGTGDDLARHLGMLELVRFKFLNGQLMSE